MEQMRPYPVPANDAARSDAVRQMDLARFAADPFFAHVTDMVKSIFDVPVAFVSMFTEEEQGFVACDGLDIPGTPRTHSLCAFTVAERKTIVIPNALVDPRSAQHPVVTQMGLRFSASAPVILSSGFCMGTVCGVALEVKPPPSQAAIDQLNALAGMIARFYEAPREPDADHLARMQDIAERAQSEFLALVGHELRTPLNGIHGMAQVLEPEDPAEQEIADTIIQSAQHLNNVVKSVLDFTELASGDVQLDIAPVALAPLIDRAAAPHSKIAQFRGRTLSIDLSPGLPKLSADAARLELALSCIINNCVIHGGEAVSITAEIASDRTLAIDICDNGPGIAPDRQHDIWNVFGVGAGISTRAADGLGLGLPLARRIIELHGGEIEAQSSQGVMRVRTRLPHWRVIQT